VGIKLRAVVVTALVLAGALVVPASAAQAESPFCNIYAHPVQLDFADGKLIGRGGRADCETQVTIRVRMREDRSWWPDRTLQERSQTGVNMEIELWHPCNPFLGNMKVFTETIVEGTGQKTSSARWVVPCHD
jgi:hypothetical protein